MRRLLGMNEPHDGDSLVFTGGMSGEMISDLASHSDLPWVGGLNEIFYHGEKRGGPPRFQSLIDSFRSAFLDNDLHDLGFFGYEFPWCNNRKDGEVVEERLGRFCTSTE